MKKAFLVVSFILSSMFIFAQSTDNNTANNPVLKGHTLYSITVYSAPGKKSNIQFDRNTEVNIIDIVDKYFVILHDNSLGYVYKNDIRYSRKELEKFTLDLDQAKKSGTYAVFFSNLKLDPNLYREEKNNTNIITNTIVAKKPVTIPDTLKYEIDHVRHCAYKYHKELIAGYVCSLAGSATILIGATQDNPEAATYIGAGLGLLGTILIIDSQKWMKRIYIGPNGAGIKYTF